MIIKTEQGWKELRVLERISQHRNVKIKKNKRITVKDDFGGESHQDYWSVELK